MSLVDSPEAWRRKPNVAPPKGSHRARAAYLAPAILTISSLFFAASASASAEPQYPNASVESLPGAPHGSLSDKRLSRRRRTAVSRWFPVHRGLGCSTIAPKTVATSFRALCWNDWVGLTT